MKEVKFEELIYDQYKDCEDYEVLRHRLLTVRELMLQHPAFKKASVNDQLYMSVTINIIVTDSILDHMNQTRPLSLPEDKVFKYSVDNGFKPMKTIEIKSRG